VAGAPAADIHCGCRTPDAGVTDQGETTNPPAPRAAEAIAIHGTRDA
jgi:hypothetical protein